MQSECWLYLGPFSHSRGHDYYGRYDREGAHRVAYRTFNGNIPKGLTIDHICRNTMCINPDHLEAVTQRVNTLRGDSQSALNARKTQAPCGHPYTGKTKYRRYCVPCVITYRKDYYSKHAK